MNQIDDRLHLWDYNERIRQPSVVGMRCRECGKRQFEAADSCPGKSLPTPPQQPPKAQG